MQGRHWQAQDHHSKCPNYKHRKEEPYATGLGREQDGKERLYYVMFLPYHIHALFYLTDLEPGHRWQHKRR